MCRAAGRTRARSIPTIAFDPRLGRIVRGANIKGVLLGTSHYGFSRPIGGGEDGAR
jgi:hypothetical protein